MLSAVYQTIHLDLVLGGRAAEEGDAAGVEDSGGRAGGDAGRDDAVEVDGDGALEGAGAVQLRVGADDDVGSDGAGRFAGFY